MSKIIDNKRSFFLLLLEGCFDLDKSLEYQLATRKLERQLLPLVYYVSIALLISKVPDFFVLNDQYADQVIQYAKLGSMLVVHLFFVPIFIYIIAFIAHGALLLFGSTSTHFITRLAVLWSLSLGSSFIVLASLVTAFITDNNIKFFWITFAEIIVIYIFAKMLSFVANFKYRQILLIVLISIYIFLNVLLPSLNQ